MGRSEHNIPPQTTGAETSGLTISALLICTRVTVTHKIEARRAEKPMPLTQLGAFHAAMSCPEVAPASCVFCESP